MTETEILAHLEQLHAENKFQQIIDDVNHLKTKQKTPEIISVQARAYNNMFWQANDTEKQISYDYLHTALKLLKSIEHELGETDTWNYRIGYTYFYLNDLQNAQQYLNKAKDLGDTSDTTQELLDIIELALYNQVSINEYLAGGKGSIEYDLNYLLAILKQNSAPLLDTFQVGIKDKQLTDFEKDLGFEVPESFKQWYRTFNGQIDGAKFIDCDGFSYILPLEKILTVRQQFIMDLEQKFGQNWQDIRLNPHEFADIDEVQNILYHQKWLPMFTGQNHRMICMDLSPQNKNGEIGQIIEVISNDDLQYYQVRWIAWSLRQFIENPLTYIVSYNPYFEYNIEQNCWCEKNARHFVKSQEVGQIHTSKSKILDDFRK